MKIIKGFAVFLLLLGAIYLLGPRVEIPLFSDQIVEVPSDFALLQEWVDEKEKALGNVRPEMLLKSVFLTTLFLKKQYTVFFIYTVLQPQVKRGTLFTVLLLKH